MDSGIILIILFLFVLNKKEKKDILDISIKKDKESSNMETNNTVELPSEKYISLNIPYTKDKIKIIKKIGPYFPDKYINPLNKSIILTERIVKLYETIEFMKISQTQYIKKSIPMANNKERLNYIMNIIKNEVSKEETKDLGMILDIILNMDKYKNIFTIANSLISDPDSLNNPNKIISLIEPLMEGKDEKEKEKLKEMIKMFEIMKTLDMSKKTN